MSDNVPADASFPRGIRALAAGVRSGELEPRAIVEWCLARIEQDEPRLRAWVVVFAEEARRQAEALAARRVQGESLGCLAGVPIGVKDLYDVAGWPTRAGAPTTPEAPVTRDAPVVARLRAADAILLGKTVTTEYACFDPPPTRNPWREDRTPGGSSSGSACALAADMCWGALGSQTGGSITRPAAYCGVTGLKPSIGALSCEGVVPISFHLDHPGPMGRSVDDLAILWQALSGQTPRGPRPTPPRLAWLNDPYWRADAEGTRCVEEAVATWRRAGAEIAVIEGAPFDWESLRLDHRRVMAVEAAEWHRERFATESARYGRHVSSLIREGQATSAIDYAAALRRRIEFQEQLAACYGVLDALLTPAATGPAPGIDSTGDPRMNALWSHAGVPTVALPGGASADGLPLGLQLASLRSESELLATAGWCERQL